MKRAWSLRRRFLVGFCGAIILLGGMYAALWAMRDSACLTESRMKIANVSGGDFEITYTNCDTLAKDEAIRVYVAKAGSQGSLLSRWQNKRTLLFMYDPGSWDAPLPTIKSNGPHQIVISILDVSSVQVQRPKWEDVSVGYEIGHVDYPGTPSPD